MNSSVRFISTSTIQATNHNESSQNKIDLTPWDLVYLKIEAIQQGLLFHKPNYQTIPHLKHTLSSTLSFFPLLTGRLVITEHVDDNTISCFIDCNNAGAAFVHAAADNTTVADILKPDYVPPNIVHSFFPLNGVKNHEGTSRPLLAVQITELVDGIFIGCAINHVVADGKSFWRFFNSWAELSRGEEKITKPTSLNRWFPNDIETPIRFPFIKNEEKQKQQLLPPVPPIRIFHFSKEKIARIKSKANEEVGGCSDDKKIKISSLQALLSHVWRSVICCQRGVDPQSETRIMLVIDSRSRLCPKLPEGYFGNASVPGYVTIKVEEFIKEEGWLGKCAWEMNKVVSLHSDEKQVKSFYESWLKSPYLITPGGLSSNTALVTNSSPRFDFYGNDFGWGKPVAVRNGVGNKSSGKITVFGGAEEGSVDIEVCFPYEILEAMGNDPIFIDA